MAIAYEVNMGSQILAGDSGSSRRPLVALDSEVGIGGIGRCLVRLGDLSWAGARVGDALTVALDAGDGSQTVFTGEVDEVVQRPDALLVWASDGLARLARIEVESAYEEVSAGFIIKDLVDRSGASAGEVEEGPTFPSYVVHRGRALRHAQRLAEFIGIELCTDGMGKIHARRPTENSPAHRLVWSEDIITLDLVERAAILDSFAIWGEGAAGTHGPERSHWLVTDLSGVNGQAAVRAGAPGSAGTVTSGSTGARMRTFVDGAVRSTEIASDLAQARASLVALRPIRGHVVVIGRPAVQPGEWVELADVPAGRSGSRSLRVRVLRVAHELTMNTGFITRLEL